MNRDFLEIVLTTTLVLCALAGVVAALTGPPILFLWLAFGGAA